MDFPIPPSVEEATAAMDLSGGGDDHVNNEDHLLNDGAAADVAEDLPNDDEADEVAEVDREDDDSTEVADDTDEKSLKISPDSSDMEQDTGISPEKADLLLIKATGLKEEGNKEFKEGDLDKAARAYRRGVNALKKLNRNNCGEEQVKALLVTLHTNLSTVSFKNSKFRVSAEVATQALNIDETNVKALYRRAVANRKLGNLEDSRADLRAAIAVDANSTVCKKELIAVKKELESAKENQKKALAKAFSGDKGGSSFLYDDKEDAANRKEEEEKRKKLEEKELVKKRKAQWEDDCVKLMASNEPAISFEDWDKQRVEREEEDHKKKESEAARRRKIERKAAKEKAAASVGTKERDESDDDDDELTEAELAMMRGYKKTADGRTTSYFTRELSQDEKNRIGDIAPKRLDECAGGNTPVRLSQPDLLSASSSTTTTTTTASAWNQAGTWEEKDTTDWCKSQLRTRLEETIVTTDTLDVVITSVEELTGDASVAVVSGKKRYIFDFHVKLKYEIKQAEEVVASGVVRLPDICSTHHDELEVDFDGGWTKRPKSDILENATAARSALADHLRTTVVQSFVQDFNDMY